MILAFHASGQPLSAGKPSAWILSFCLLSPSTASIDTEHRCPRCKGRVEGCEVGAELLTPQPQHQISASVPIASVNFITIACSLHEHSFIRHRRAVIGAER